MNAGSAKSRALLPTQARYLFTLEQCYKAHPLARNPTPQGARQDADRAGGRLHKVLRAVAAVQAADRPVSEHGRDGRVLVAIIMWIA